jgi:hypothetical protein
MAPAYAGVTRLRVSRREAGLTGTHRRPPIGGPGKSRDQRMPSGCATTRSLSPYSTRPTTPAR